MKKYIMKNKILFFINTIIIISLALLDVFKSYIFGQIVDTLTVNKPVTNLIYMAILFVSLFFIFYTLSDTLYFKLCNKILVTLRRDVFKGALNTEVIDFEKNLGSNYLNNISNDLNIIFDDYLCNIKEIIFSIASFCIALYVLFTVNITYGIFILSLSTVPILISKTFIKSLENAKNTYSKSFHNLIAKTKNILDGFYIIKEYNLEDKILKNFEFENLNLENSRFKSKVKESYISNTSGCISISIFLSILLLGAYLVSQNKISIGQMIMISQLSNSVINPIKNISVLTSKMKSVNIIYKKLEKVIDINNDLNLKLIDKDKFTDSIEIKDLSFSYDNKSTILNDVNLNFKFNKKYALIGESGCGKSTLIKIIQGLYKTFDGELLIDNINIKHLSSKSINNLICSIDQNIFLFNDTIKNNICLYNSYSKDNLTLAIKISGLEDIINKLENGIETQISENGNNLSGGQKQRIAIARAIIKNTPILILDESTSSLDPITKFEIEKTILSLENKTILFITHNIDTLENFNFNQIISFGKDIHNIDSNMEKYHIFANNTY